MWSTVKAWYSQLKVPHNTHFEIGRLLPMFCVLFAWGAYVCLERFEHALLAARVPGVVTKIDIHKSHRSPRAAAQEMSYVDYQTVAFQFERDGDVRVERNDYPLTADYRVGETVEVSYLPGRDMREAKLVGEPVPGAVYFFLSMMAVSGAGVVWLVVDSLREPDFVRTSRYRAWQRKG